MTEYVHVGSHADVLASGRPVAPGERVTDKDLALTVKDEIGEDQHLIDEGRLADVKSFGDRPKAPKVNGDSDAS